MIKFVRQVFGIISPNDRRRLIVIFFMILISGFFDLVGVSIILPIVSLLSAPSTETAIEGNTILRLLSVVFNTSDTYKLSILALISIIIIYMIKISYSFLMTYINTKFMMSFNRRLRARLMRIYLAMPYEYHHENNSSTLIRKSTYDVDVFCSAVSGFLSFLVKIVTSTTIIVYLFITSYIITLITGALLVLFATICIYLLKNKNRKFGREIQRLSSNNYKYLSQSFNGIKESKISNNEEFFVREYISNIEEINHISIKKTMYASIPGHSLEFVGILGIVVSLLVIIVIGGTERYKIISTFAVFAYAVIKLLPCVTEITSYINSFAFYSSSVDSINKDLNEVEKLEEQIETYDDYTKLPFEKLIQIKNVAFSYKDEPDKYVLKDISFEIHKNSSVAISGNSGAGKTTLVDIILGLLKPTSGSVFCDDNDVNQNVRGWRDNLSYVPQNIFLTDDTIRNNVAFGIAKNKVDDRKIWEALEKAQLKEFVEQTAKGLDTIIGERGVRLSGGQRQRVGIARAFYRNTNVIVLDEATSALDYETEKNILDHITEYSKDHTLIIITHRLNTIDMCDYIYQIVDGKLTCKKSL